MAYAERVDLIFLEEVREKKKAASGVHSKTGKRGYVGKMLFPTDFMSSKEKRQYRKASKVMSYSYNELLPIDKLKELAIETQRELVIAWRDKFPAKQMKEFWGWKDYQLYRFFDEIGVIRSERAKPKEKKEKPMKTKAPAQLASFSVSSEDMPTAMPQVEVMPPKQVQQGMRLEFNGEYETPEAINRLMKIASLLEGEEKKYQISIILQER